MRTAIVIAALLGPVLAALSVFAGDAVVSPGEPVLEPATLHCLGVYWIVPGDDNTNARIDVAYRVAGTEPWQDGPALFRVERGASDPADSPGDLSVPSGAWLFAGSIVSLRPDTAYELRLQLSDPDGGRFERRLIARTMAEPVLRRGAPVSHVIPGDGGGSGTADDPYRGLASAQKRARPGDVFLLHAGRYEGTFTIDRSGEPGMPIVWRGAGDGEAMIDGQGKTAARPGAAVSAYGVHDVWLQRLTVRNAVYAISANNSARMVIRGCRLDGCDYGIASTKNANDATAGFFISDNVLIGPSTWPRSKGIENARGIQLTGTGHVVCYNRIRGFADAIDTFPSRQCSAIDFHNNDISEMTDDGIEMDYSRRNTRCFANRLTNVFQGISLQPVYGGPVYVYRNVLVNVVQEPFKMHNGPSGALVYHNTSVKSGMPVILQTGEAVRNCVTRNNLFLGTAARYAFESTAPMVACDFDYDGFGGGPWATFLKWNGVRYASLAEVVRKAPVYRNAVTVDPATLFASGLLPPEHAGTQLDPAAVDCRLRDGSDATDRGVRLPGFNDAFRGRAPDLGALELGDPLPHVGPRPERGNE